MKSMMTSGLCCVSVILFMVAASSLATSPLEFEGVKSLVRNERQAVAAVKTSNGTEDISKLNIAEEVSEDYPVVFNMLLWLGVAMFIATLAICVAIASMDPGRDSLIYRVTSAQRFKKDN